MARNAANPQAVRDAERMEQAKASQFDGDLRWVMSDPRGRRFIHQLMESCHVFDETVFNGHGGVMSLNEGQRTVGTNLYRRTRRVCPELYLLMDKEALTAAASDGADDDNEQRGITDD